MVSASGQPLMQSAPFARAATAANSVGDRQCTGAIFGEQLLRFREALINEGLQRCVPPAWLIRGLPSRLFPLCTQFPSSTRPNVPFVADRINQTLPRVGEGVFMRSSEQTTMGRTIRRKELRDIVPLADSTIYEMEQWGEFPRRFAMTPRCVVWDLAEVNAWLAARRATRIRRAKRPEVSQRTTHPVKARVQAPE